jgi:hypothetical protein
VGSPPRLRDTFPTPKGPLALSTPALPFSRRALAWLHRNRWLIVITLAALIVRLHWNLEVHPIGDYIGSDMKGYDTRANQLLDDASVKREYHAFFPYGTHFVVAAIKMIFGRDNYPAIAAVYALMGALVVAFSYLIARRVSKRAWVPPLVGLILVCYYPLISLGGYMLSEIPMATFLTLATLGLLRLAEHGRARDAWLAGIAVAIATAMRPQALVSVAFFAVAWLFFRKSALAKVKLYHLLYAGLPLLAVLAFSAARFHHHTGRYGLVSENGTFNQVFGHCHTKMITAKGKSTIKFGPPPLIQLERRAQKYPDAFVKLDPAISAEIEFKGYIADEQKLRGLLRQCWKNKGLAGQIKYTTINVILLVAHNTMWPDSGRPQWREIAKEWGKAHLILLTLPCFFGLFTVLSRRTVARHGILALHVWALLVTAALYFGDTRLRCPYDPFIVILAIEVYAVGGAWLLARLRGRSAAKSAG